MISLNRVNVHASRYLLSLLLLLPLLGCQQTQLVFTDAQAPVTPTFNRLKGAPQLQSPQIHTERPQELQTPTTESPPAANLPPKLSQDIESWAPIVHPLTVDFTLHLFPASPSKLNYVELVLINSGKPFNNIDILNAALNERAIWLATQHPISCIESLRIRATMHSINMKMACPPQEVPQALNILAASWQDSAFDKIDIDNVRRTLKLNKHINAYSGAEIDQVWANIILGDMHPYNQALNNLVLQNELSLSKLAELQQEMRAEARWHLLMSLPADHRVSGSAQSNLLTQEDLIAEAERLAKLLTQSAPITAKQGREDTVDAANFVGATQDTAFSNTGKIIYLIDAPGAVQTQVRVGYRLPLSVSSAATDTINDEFSSSHPLSCQLLADWLGRSFSGRLYYDLREKRGLTYGIYGRCFDNPQSRTLKYYASTQIQHSGAFVAGILAHLRLAAEQEMTSAELSALKLYENSKYTLTMQSQHSSKLAYIKQLTLERSSEDLANMQIQITALTGKDLMQMSASIFDSPPYIILRGDADKISQDLTDKLPSWKIKSIEP